jgi:hypothetical protein
METASEIAMLRDIKKEETGKALRKIMIRR